MHRSTINLFFETTPAEEWLSSQPEHWTAKRLADVVQWRAEQRPDQPAFTFLKDFQPAGALTFADLDERARAVGAELQARGAAGQPVMLMLDPGLDYVAALFGCLYAGAIALPVYPPDPFRIARTLPRLQAIIANAGCKLILCESSSLQASARAVAAIVDTQLVAVDRLDGASAAWQPSSPAEEDCALLQYTSGTTGSAKGVAITHANLMFNLRSLEDLLDVDEAVALNWIPPFHDLGLVGSVLLTAFAGRHSILMSPLDFMRSPAGWLQAISRWKATTSASPNFAYELCVRKVTEKDCAGLDLSCWRVAVSGGEPVRAETLDRFAERFGPYGFRREAFIPAYGLAEATLMVSVQRINGVARRKTFDANALARHELRPSSNNGDDARTLVSCGPPGPEVDVRIVDPDTNQETEGVGEVWIRTPGVARGYWRREAETAAAFAARTATGEGDFLRTGDFGFLDDGELFVTGRCKEMLILAGRNYYPHDIEAAIQSRHPALKRDGGAVVAVEYNNEERVAVFQEVQRPKRNDLAELMRLIRATVAEEVGQEPHTVVLLPVGEIPKTSSGKLQRSACWDAYQQKNLSTLLQWSGDDHPADPEPGEEAAEGEEAVGDTEEWLAACWADVLGLRPIYRHHNFVQLGGRSLQVIEMMKRVAERTGRELHLAAVFEHPTLAEFASYIDQAPESLPRSADQPCEGNGAGTKTPDAWSSLVLLQPTGDRPPLFCVHPAGGTVFCYSDLARQFHGERPVVGLQAVGVDGRHPPHESMQEMVNHYRQTIESFCPSGPFHLCGWSLGGNVAYELACQMRADGQPVGLVAMFDSGAVPLAEDVSEDDLMPLISALFPDMKHMPLATLKAMETEKLVQFFAERASRARLIDDRQLWAGGYILNVFSKNMEVFVNHRPTPYVGSVLLFRAGLQATMHASLGDDCLGWDGLAPNLEVIDIDCDHTRMLNPPQVDQIARGLSQALKPMEAAVH